jgi:hypothetical protein
MTRTSEDKVIGDRLRSIRKSKHLTQRGLGRLTGQSNIQISRIECGETGLTVVMLLRFSRALEIDPSEILGEGARVGRMVGVVGKGGVYCAKPSSGAWEGDSSQPSPPGGEIGLDVAVSTGGVLVGSQVWCDKDPSSQPHTSLAFSLNDSGWVLKQCVAGEDGLFRPVRWLKINEI